MHKQDSTWKKVLFYIRPYSFYVILSLLFAVLTGVLTLYAPILVGDAIDFIIGKDQVLFDRILDILKKLAVIIAITGVGQWLMNLCNNQITYRVVRDVRLKAFKKLERLPLSYVDSHANGDTISRIITDVEQFSDGLLMGFTQFFSGVVTIVTTLIFMLTIDVKITLVVVLLTPLSFFVAGFIAKRTYQMFKKQSEARADMTSLVNEMVGNQKVVQAFGYGSTASERFDEINGKLKTYSLKAIFFSSITNPSTRFVNNLVYMGVGITGALSAMSGIISVGQLSCFLTYANQYTKPFNEISGVVTELQNALACAKRVFDFIEEEPEPKDDKDAVVLIDAKGNLDLEHVSFSYKKEVPLLKDLNLNVKPGQKIAIVGPTGCGKTTLINLLMRFYDVTAGSISVDGHDIRNLSRQDYRKQFGMVLQDAWLFEGTIKENLRFGNLEATDEEIVEAAKAANVDHFIRTLPGGYNMEMNQESSNISLGQKQLLTIARALLADPKILILDEATSSVDTRLELLIQKAMKALMQGRTSFVIAHRLSTIQEADKILFLKDGQIIEQGNHESLLADKGFYYDLYNSQFAEK